MCAEIWWGAMTTFEIGTIVNNPQWNYSGSSVNGQNFKPDGWFGTSSTADLQQDGVWETNQDVGRSGLWFDDSLDSVENSGDTYMAFGGRTREAIGTETTQDLSAGDEVVIDFSYVVSNTTAPSFEPNASGIFRFQIGSDFVDVNLQMPSVPTEPWWQSETATITLTSDVPAGTRFNMQAISGGYVGIDALGGVPCFVEGTRILTREGEVPVEELVVGDLVFTRDAGLQEVRWIGSRTAQAIGNYAPIHFAKGSIGNSRALRVSPQHRMLITGYLAQLHLGVDETLIPAKMMVNDSSITRVTGGSVVYYHLMFDQHQVVYSEGVPTESFHPGEFGLKNLNHQTRVELEALFPELFEEADAEILTAHSVAKSFEAPLLVK